VVLFDSLASPDLLPPQAYAQHVQPVTARLIDAFQQAGCPRVPIIIGGDTTPILGALIATGADNLLCDFSADWSLWKEKCAAAGRSVRRNLPASLVHTGPPEAIEAAARDAVCAAQGFPDFILGTAVVPYATPTEHLLAVRRACKG
jgi:uroporphyrinogen decarboxylase